MKRLSQEETAQRKMLIESLGTVIQGTISETFRCVILWSSPKVIDSNFTSRFVLAIQLRCKNPGLARLGTAFRLDVSFEVLVAPVRT